MSLIYNAIFDKNTRKLSFEDKAGNEIYSFIVPERAPAVDDITKPLTFRATQDGSTVKLTRNNSPTGRFQTSRDGGNTWEDYTIDTAIALNIGDEVSFRIKSFRTSAQNANNYFQFNMTGKIEAWHNVMSLYRPSDFATYNTTVNYSFYRLFDSCTSLVKAPALPATTLATHCYEYMFNGCTSLTEAPALPATALANNCYQHMFYGCTSLTRAPELPATTLATHCYDNMFRGCTSLTKAPELPATTLATYCYRTMFGNCTSLTEAPALPATTLADYCYQYMFDGCTSLTKAPVLPATTLAPECYKGMFNGCSRLNEVRCKMPSSYSSSQISTYASSWLYNVSSTGTFYTNADANWPSGESGIPTGWTRVNEGEKDDITKPLTFKATQDGSTVTLKKKNSPSGDFQTSRDGGNTWSDYTTNTDIALNTGEEVSFRAKADRTSAQTMQDYFYFEMTGKIEAWHNVMSMYRTNDFATYDIVVDFSFYRMFSGCTSLTKAPALPATALATYCYANMFNGCTSLTNAPELPATALGGSCYNNMFNGCTSLTNAPELPATALAQQCYYQMFSGCTSLTKSPVLPATTLAQYCYYQMFKGCRNLNEVHCNMPSLYSSDDISSYASNWLSGVSSIGTFYTNADANWPSGASGIPTGWNRVNEGAPTVDDITKPLTFKATQDGSTVKLAKYGSPSGAFQTSRDGGNTWVDYTLNTSITLNTGGEVSFRAKDDRTTDQNGQNYFYFMMEGEIEAWHNVMSMSRTSDFATYNTVMNYAFYRLFKGCTSLTKAPVLPATTLAKKCYSNMFSGCTSLTEAPVLPATDFDPDLGAIIDASYCYESMFYGCTSLTKAPELPATRLERFCYYNMFYGCTSLTKAPELPATILEESCYESMFSGCASLTEAPELPATTLMFNCYSGMFNYCTSLVNAPALPATKLSSGCYNWMFARCISLTKSPELRATTLANGCYTGMFLGCGKLNEVRCQMPSTVSADKIPEYTGSSTNSDSWLLNVSSTGTFYTNADANWPSGASGIPTSWTRVNEEAPAVDDPNKPLMLRAIEDNSYVRLEKNGTLSNTYQTSTNGTDWTDYTFGTEIPLNKGESVYFRCNRHPTTQSGSNYVRFHMWGKIEAWHNAYSMISSSFTDTSASVGSYGMYLLFYICEALTKAPLLLNALAEHCYDGLFYYCPSLKQAPSLPATTLAEGCYDGMFSDCRALTQAPSLPATTLAYGCYKGMFARCSNLKEVRVSATKTAIDALNSWLSGVSATGDFYCDPNATIFPTGTSGIPANWNRHDIADYPTT